MPDTILQVENLGKKYLIKHQQQVSYTALRDVITDKVKSLGKRIIFPWNHKQSSTHSTTEEFWALKDISFKVKQGEVVGIIGRNGAGKSTLLKILSRITEPTKGRIRINGRVASLLEVGTGFHPELTGRENIFLNGAILGMGKAEIKRKFDEIVAFAEIEKFLDTPVKRYSSGMYVRLAFAVAAHLEPEILLVDEVLAVGDAAFQKKCLGKMGDVAKEGRTVLFVSHNMGAVRHLCSSVIHLDHGRVVGTGSVESIIDQYLRGIPSIDSNSPKTAAKFLREIEFIDSSSHKVDSILAGSGGSFRVHFEVNGDVLTNVCVTIGVYELTGIKVVQLTTDHAYEKPTIEILSGKGHIDCQMDEILLTPGQYRVNVAFDGHKGNGTFHDGIANGCQLTVMPSDYYGTLRMKTNEEGFVLVKQRWIIEEGSNNSL